MKIIDGLPQQDCEWKDGVTHSFWVVSDWVKTGAVHTEHDPKCVKMHWPSRIWILNGLIPASQTFEIELKRFGYFQTVIGGSSIGGALLEAVAKMVAPQSGRLVALVRPLPRVKAEDDSIVVDWDQVGAEDLQVLSRCSPGWEVSPIAPVGAVAIVTGPYPDRH